MKREILQTTKFRKAIEVFIAKKKMINKDFEDFKKSLAENPEMGDLIKGTGGVRKIRLKSSSGGKSGGFRVCYYYYIKNELIYLILVYQKNEQENITSEQKKILKEIANEIKKI